MEPFFGSGAVLFGRPSALGTETVNDLDGFVANFWRATQHDPEQTAMWADEPVNENDLHAKHVWLVAQRALLARKLEGSPDWFDARIAGYWVWGVSCWIGGGFCSGEGPWRVNADGHLLKQPLPHLGDAGQGVNRQIPHLGDAGRGVKRQIPHLGSAGRGVKLLAYFEQLRRRMESVRVASGDWSRVCGPSVTHQHGMTGVFLDPPYADTAMRSKDVYRVDSSTVAHDVREWAILNGENLKMRIALCGYDGEHEMPSSWECVPWKAGGGYANQGDGSNQNAAKERIWFSPACLSVASGYLL